MTITGSGKASVSTRSNRSPAGSSISRVTWRIRGSRPATRPGRERGADQPAQRAVLGRVESRSACRAAPAPGRGEDPAECWTERGRVPDDGLDVGVPEHVPDAGAVAPDRRSSRIRRSQSSRAGSSAAEGDRGRMPVWWSLAPPGWAAGEMVEQCAGRGRSRVGAAAASAAGSGAAAGSKLRRTTSARASAWASRSRSTDGREQAFEQEEPGGGGAEPVMHARVAAGSSSSRPCSCSAVR